MKESRSFPKPLLLWSGELISSIGGGLTSFGLGVCFFQKTGSTAGMAADAPGRIGGRGVGRGAALVIVTAGICLAVTASAILFPKSIRKLEKKSIMEEQSKCTQTA